jgi:alkaline phosphatase D
VNTHIILLDVRYFRDKIEHSKGHYIPNTSGSILGKEQWSWLENILSTSNADCIVLGTGIQAIPDQHIYEKWSNFPSERSRLIGAIANCGKPAIIISGDRHIGEISILKGEDASIPIIEVTSSSLTHSWTGAMEHNRFRVGPLVDIDNFGIIDLYRKNNSLHTDFKIVSEGGIIESSTSISYSLQ